MSSLKEVKSRIASVSNTRKITQARQMISSAQLHQAQGILSKASGYKKSLDSLLFNLNCNDSDVHPLMQQQDTDTVAIVMISSNSGMCGAFNANMIKKLSHIAGDYPKSKLLFFPIGKKIWKAVEAAGYPIGYKDNENLRPLTDKSSYNDVAELASYLMELYQAKIIKQVELFYYEYKSMAIQVIKKTTFLPYSIPSDLAPQKESEHREDYIFELSKGNVLGVLIPMLLKSNLYHAFIENQTSEHAARTMAMQLATENADELLTDLRLMYNKLRQQNITSELLDIVGGSFA